MCGSREHTACYGVGRSQLTSAPLLQSLHEPRSSLEEWRSRFCFQLSSAGVQEGKEVREQTAAFYSALWESMRGKEWGSTLLIFALPQFHAALVQKEGVNPRTSSGVYSASFIHDFPRCPTTKFLYLHLQRQHPHLSFLLTGDLS